MSVHPDLPEICFVFIEHEGSVATIQREKSGRYEPSNLPEQALSDPDIAKAWVDRQNENLGVTPAQREAMLAGSMFGWHLPLADPGVHTMAEPYFQGTAPVGRL